MEDKIIYTLQNAIENGYTPSDIKKSVINTLDSYFIDKTVLMEYATSSEILSVYEYIVKYNQDNDFSKILHSVLNCYRAAYNANPEYTLEIILSTREDFSQKENMMWTVRQQVPNRLSEDSYDTIMAWFNYIGQSLEIGVKHIIFELYALTRIINGKSVDYESIRKCEFGVVINNIIQEGYFEDILKTKPVTIKLSDWRNIAYHHTYEIEKDTIICTYGKQRLSFKTDLKQLEQYTHQIIRTSNLLNIGRCIYVFDNLSKIRNHSNVKHRSIEFRKPMLINQLKISLSSQGFHLERIEEDTSQVKAILYDMKNNGMLSKSEEKERKIHSSQFTYNFWVIFLKNKISIVYCDKQGKELFISLINGYVCEKIKEGKEDFSYLAKHIELNEITRD